VAREVCREEDLVSCICRAQDERRGPSIGCREGEPCYVCWRCGKYFPYSSMAAVEAIRCPCCGYRAVSKALIPWRARSTKAV